MLHSGELKVTVVDVPRFSQVPVQPKAGTHGLRSFIIPADTLEKFLVCTSNASENHTLHSIGFLAGEAVIPMKSCG